MFFVCSCNHNAANPEKEKTSELAAGETLYSLTVNASANGKITPNKTSEIRAGEEIVLIIEPNEGYMLKTLTVITEEKKDIAVAAVSKGTVYKFTMPIGNVTVNSEFVIKTVTEDLSDPQADGAVLYKIEHWLQDVDDLETYELAVIQTKSGEAGDETTAAAKTYAGFNVVPFTQKTISENGNTVVKIFYNRKTITYTFNPNGGNWDGDTAVKTVTGVYGAVLSLENPKRPGYDITWDKTKPLTFETINLDFTAGWVARNDTKYTVKYYEQNVEGGNNYTLLSSEERTGTTDTNTNVTASSKTGFSKKEIEQININGDGSSIVNVYYDRLSYTITFNTNGGSTIPSQQVLYGAIIEENDTPIKQGFTFWKWYQDSDLKYPYNNSIITSDITLYALWICNSINYSFTDEVIKLPAGTDGTYGTNGEYVLFGDFPQSSKLRSVIIDENIATILGNLIVYLGDDGFLYTKVDMSYYKIEPIKWRVLSKDANGKALLLSESILYGDSWNGQWKEVAEYDRIYTYSTIYDDLEQYFLKTAFTSSAIDSIQVTSIIPSYYDASDNLKVKEEMVKDTKVFLLSRDEVFSIYEFDDESRKRYTTDFAAFGNNYYISWWLRTAKAPRYADVVDLGVLEKNPMNYAEGVVPAITVYLPD